MLSESIVSDSLILLAIVAIVLGSPLVDESKVTPTPTQHWSSLLAIKPFQHVAGGTPYPLTSAPSASQALKICVYLECLRC